MNRVSQIFSVLTAVLLVSACSHTPMPVARNHPRTDQLVMQAAHHWEVLAAHVADKIVAKLSSSTLQTQPAAYTQPVPTYQPNAVGGGYGAYNAGGNVTPMQLYNPGQPAGQPYGQPPMYGAPGNMGYQPQPGAYNAYANPAPAYSASAAPSSMPALYVPPPVRTDPIFEQAFTSLLRTHLVSAGMMVTDKPDGPFNTCYGPDIPCSAMTVNYDIQVVHHKGRDTPMRFPGQLTAALLGGGAIAYILEEADNNGEKLWAVAPFALFSELAMAKKFFWPNETNTEVVISTTVTDGNLVVFSDSSIYYIHANDDDHYDQGGKTYKMVSQ